MKVLTINEHDGSNIWWQYILHLTFQKQVQRTSSPICKYAITNHISTVYWWKNYLAHLVGSFCLLFPRHFRGSPGHPWSWRMRNWAWRSSKPMGFLGNESSLIAARLAKLMGRCEWKCGTVLTMTRPCLAIVYHLSPLPPKKHHIQRTILLSLAVLTFGISLLSLLVKFRRAAALKPLANHHLSKSS